MIKLAQELDINPLLIEKIKNLSGRELKKVNNCTAKCFKGDFSCLKKEKDLIRLAVTLQCAVKLKAKYSEYGISDSIYYATMSDIKIWCENCGNKGLHNYGWLKNHVSFELFRLGRLQFQLYECKNRTLLYNKLPFSYGEKLIYVHIPQGEKLIKEDCINAFKTANRFFEKYFPDYNYRYYFSESWLLYDNNKEFMSSDSNILAFSTLFTHCYSVKIDKQAIERIFGKRQLMKKNYPEKTSLQKSSKKYMLNGGKLGVGVAVVKKTFFLTSSKR